MTDQEAHIISRSPTHIDPDAFAQIFRLVREHMWLEKRNGALLELWNMCTTRSEQELLLDLCSRFSFVQSSDLEKFGRDFADHIVNVWEADPEATLIVAISDKPDADGSQAMIQSIKNSFATYGGWKESNFVNSIGQSLSKLKTGSTVVFADDFVGTGRTVVRKVKWYQRKISERKINKVRLALITIGCMDFSKKNLDELGIQHYSAIDLKKGITEVLLGDKLQNAISAMERLESQLHPTSPRDIADYSFGFGRCEALFALEAFNVPNNVFPIYWWPRQKNNAPRKTMFQRLEP